MSSFSAQFWAVVVLGLILYIGALCAVLAMTELVRNYEGEMDPRLKEDVEFYLGSVQASALTLYQCVSSGVDWGDVYQVVSQAGRVASVQFMLFMVFFTFAVWNILTKLGAILGGSEEILRDLGV